MNPNGSERGDDHTSEERKQKQMAKVGTKPSDSPPYCFVCVCVCVCVLLGPGLCLFKRERRGPWAAPPLKGDLTGDRNTEGANAPPVTGSAPVRQISDQIPTTALKTLKG